MRHGTLSFRAFLGALACAAGGAVLVPSTPATAAAITYADPYCAQFFTINGTTPGDVLLRCVKAMTCSIAPVNSSYIVPSGTAVTLQATCTSPSAQTYNWSTGVLSPQGCPAPVVTADPTKATVTSTTSRVCWYEVVGADATPAPNTVQGIARYGIAWTDPAPTGCTASVSPTSLPSSGGSVNLNGGCTGGPVTSWAWTRNSTTGVASTQSATDNLPANSTGSPVSYTYALTACNGISCAAPVTASPGPVVVAAAPVPSGCTIAPTPSNASLPSSGGNVSMTASCTGGGPFTQFNWRKSGNPFGTNSATVGDTLPSNPNSTAITYTYDVQVCNSAGCAPRVTQTFSVAGVTVSAGFCGQYSGVVYDNMPWNTTPDWVTSIPNGPLSAGGVWVITITVPAGASSATAQGHISWAEYSSSPTFRLVTISTQPCDFRGYPSSFPTDPTGATAPLKWSGGTSGDVYYDISPRTSSGNPQLAPGTYYMNMRNYNFQGNPSCTASTCDAIVHNVAPH